MSKKLDQKSNKVDIQPKVRPLFWALLILTVLVSACVIRVNIETARAINTEEFSD